MHGDPAMPAGFSHFGYVNPDAPKGGRLVQGVLGGFDGLNPFIVKGLPPQGLRAPLVSGSNLIAGYVVESLMVRGYDEPFTLYGLLAQTVETDAARSHVTFGLNPAARFSDGQPVTVEDVIFSWRLLRDHGRPNHRIYYSKVIRAEAQGASTVRFDLPGDDRELPLILGLMPVLAKHAVNPDTFEDTSMTPLVGSGPYRVSAVDPGKSLTLARNPDYWGRDLGVNRGFWNFDEVRADYYRDANSFHEAFKKGLFDVRKEDDPGRWQTAYDFPALRDQRVVKEAFSSGLPKPSFNFVFNTRRSVFADIRVREAIALLFDFEWVNRSIFFDLYRRSAGFFDDSELSAIGRAADARERALLAPYPEAVRPGVLDGTWAPPATDGSGRDRTVLRRALVLLASAGYQLRGTELVEQATGKPLSFEILTVNRDEERLALLFASQLKRAGISAQVRLVDAVQYEARRIAFDFDMIQNRWDESLSPGNEQAFYWSSAAAESSGSRNYMGAKSPAIDAMIATLLKAETRSEVVAAVRSLDRVLISASYVVPLFYVPEQWVARWRYIERPKSTSMHGYLPETWWRQPKAQ
ncbi:MAG: ABC transporter substrate-binding protein [Alphaproteobacteria bacterium]|nr:MAG: ABC transporter substrate-binding protein [Alphaproteobacteria bacterium]